MIQSFKSPRLKSLNQSVKRLKFKYGEFFKLLELTYVKMLSNSDLVFTRWNLFCRYESSRWK